MLRSDELTLITETGGGLDANGFELAKTETRRTVYCDVRSVSVSEFYTARAAGFSADRKAVMYADEYHGEALAEYEGKRMAVTRTYVNGQDIELTLSELRERMGDHGQD